MALPNTRQPGLAGAALAAQGKAQPGRLACRGVFSVARPIINTWMAASRCQSPAGAQGGSRAALGWRAACGPAWRVWSGARRRAHVCNAVQPTRALKGQHRPRGLGLVLVLLRRCRRCRCRRLLRGRLCRPLPRRLQLAARLAAARQPLVERRRCGRWLLRRLLCSGRLGRAPAAGGRGRAGLRRRRRPCRRTARQRLPAGQQLPSILNHGCVLGLVCGPQALPPLAKIAHQLGQGGPACRQDGQRTAIEARHGLAMPWPVP